MLEQEAARRDALAKRGDPAVEGINWRIEYLENLLVTLDQFPLLPDRFVELLKSNLAITNPRFPDIPHASVDLLARWEDRGSKQSE